MFGRLFVHLLIHTVTMYLVTHSFTCSSPRSDNGAPPATDDVNHQVGKNPGWIARNHPFRGYKTLIWEGGTRVAGFIHSAMLPASVRGTVSNVMMHVTDWLPTIVALAGGSTDRNLPLDGHNQCVLPEAPRSNSVIVDYDLMK